MNTDEKYIVGTSQLIPLSEIEKVTIDCSVNGWLVWAVTKNGRLLMEIFPTRTELEKKIKSLFPMLSISTSCA